MYASCVTNPQTKPAPHVACRAPHLPAEGAPLLPSDLDGYGHEAPSNIQYFAPLDWNGDGVAETTAQAQAQYKVWAPVFVAQLRQRLGPKAVMIANTGSSSSDSSLNGVSVEMESCVASRGGVGRCIDWLLASYDASIAAGRQPLSTLWLTHGQSMPPEEQCAHVATIGAQYPWVHAGTDFFDGSFIVCNHTIMS